LSAVESAGVRKRVTETTTPSVAGSASRLASVCSAATHAAPATTGSTSCKYTDAKVANRNVRGLGWEMAPWRERRVAASPAEGGDERGGRRHDGPYNSIGVSEGSSKRNREARLVRERRVAASPAEGGDERGGRRHDGPRARAHGAQRQPRRHVQPEHGRRRAQEAGVLRQMDARSVNGKQFCGRQ
jgi:hypothetical protein